MGGTGDQRATIDDCTRFWMSCMTPTKWIAPFKMTLEVSKEVSVVTEYAFRPETLFPRPAGATTFREKEMWKRFLTQISCQIIFFSKHKYKLYTWLLEQD